MPRERLAIIIIFGHVRTCHGKQTNNLLRPRAAIRGHYLGAELTFIQRNKREGRKGQTNKNDHYQFIMDLFIAS